MSTNQLFIGAVIYITIYNVNYFAVDKLTTITALDFKNEPFFRTCSVANNLVVVLEVDRVRCATMLCHFAQTRNGSVATQFFLLSSSATSSATGN